MENESCIADIAMKSTHGICRLTRRGITYEPRSDVDGVARRERHNIGELRRIDNQAVSLEVGDTANVCNRSNRLMEERQLWVPPFTL